MSITAANSLDSLSFFFGVVWLAFAAVASYYNRKKKVRGIISSLITVRILKIRAKEIVSSKIRGIICYPTYDWGTEFVIKKFPSSEKVE